MKWFLKNFDIKVYHKSTMEMSFFSKTTCHMAKKDEYESFSPNKMDSGSILDTVIVDEWSLGHLKVLDPQLLCELPGCDPLQEVPIM